jgi:hypothetical protein
MDTLNPNQPANAPVDPMDRLSPVPAAMPAAETPQAQTPAATVPPIKNNYEVEENITVGKRRSRGPLMILMSLFIVLILLVGSAAFLGLVAYGKVGINNPELERKISFAIQELPLTPKTAEFLIYKSMDAQKDLKSLYVDASIALSGSGKEAIPGLGNKFDLKITGPIDLHDENNPKTEISIQMSPEFDANFVTVNDKVFFKINEIPAVIKGLASGAGFSLDPLLAKWISYDLKTLESDARDLLDEDKTARDSERYDRIKAAILSSKAIDKIVVAEKDLDGIPAYELTLEMTSDEYSEFVNGIAKAIDPDAYSSDLAMGTSSSQEFENLKIITYLDKSSMHTLRSMISFRLHTSDFDVPTQVLGASTIANFPNIYTQAAGSKDDYMDVAAVVNGSRFNEEFEVKEPEPATPLEDIIEQYTKQMMSKYDTGANGFDESSGFGGVPDTSQPYIDGYTGEEDDSSGFE